MRMGEILKCTKEEEVERERELSKTKVYMKEPSMWTSLALDSNLKLFLNQSLLLGLIQVQPSAILSNMDNTNCLE